LAFKTDPLSQSSQTWHQEAETCNAALLVLPEWNFGNNLQFVEIVNYSRVVVAGVTFAEIFEKDKTYPKKSNKKVTTHGSSSTGRPQEVVEKQNDIPRIDLRGIDLIK